MKLTNGKNGSALLIVLGMLSFMVVSAVGFAVYMRQSRAPSSHLRRESTARYLLKSALANAISRLDGELNGNGYVEGVFTDPYPGVGPAQQLSDQFNGDLWTHRVFTPFGLTNEESTVSTMTLEGLAYLPPAIINEARVYSRLTKTAVWKNLSYDLGRYAFTAIDVSDCFDINRLRANERRSSAPGQRVNMSSLFENNAAELDTVLDSADPIPLVSLADFNLLGNGSFTPFSQYIGSAGGSFYNSGDDQYVSNALFIVDTWFPPTNRTDSAAVQVHDIAAGPDNQPFRDYNATSFLDLMLTDSQTDLGKILVRNLGAGFACLYDYLDADQIPISLALPTVETAPMVCALGLLNNEETQLMPKVEESADGDVEYKKVFGGKTHTMKRTFTKHSYKGIGVNQLMLKGVAAYPFKRVDSGRRGSFKVQAVAAVFMADSGLKCRLANNSPIRPTQSEWSGSGGTERDGVLFFKGETALSFDDIAKTTDALKSFNIPLQGPNASESSLYFTIKVEDVTPMNERGDDFVAIETRTFKTADSTPEDSIVYDANGERVKATTLYTGGRKDELIRDPDRLSNLPASDDQNEITFTGANTYRPTVAVWVRVLNGSDVVDLAPAVVKDDIEMLQSVNYEGLESEELMLALCGKGTPILDFVTDRTFMYSDHEENGFVKLDGTTPANYTGWTDLYAADPRFNFAPEDWFGTSDANGDVTPSSWLTALGANTTTGSGGVFGSDGRDTDVFMFTSDQEYLQSMGELAFIPNLQTMDGSAMLLGKGSDGYNTNTSRYDGNNNFNSRTWSTVANKDFIWRTYTPVSHSGSGTDAVYELTMDGNNGQSPAGKEIVSGSGDFRANPFSPDSRILASVVKDTPYDYYVASTNDALSVLSKKAGVSESRQYAFGAKSTSSSAKWDDGEIVEISGLLRNGFSNAAKDGKTDWMSAFSNLKWYDGKTGDEQTTFLGSQPLNNPLHGVDRKYLYSFWRECFQNRQQLFLVFIRAEPLTVGGASGDAISNSQLGARGVALVWRDPEAPQRSGSTSSSSGGSSSRQMSRSQWQDDLKDNGPHRTRVLFYHQFD